MKDLLDLMGTSWPIALGILFTSAGILLAEHYDLSYLDTLPEWAPGLAFITSLISGSVLAVSLIRWAINEALEPLRRKRRLVWQSKHVDGLADLPDSERYILAWAVANSTQVIAAPYFNPQIKALIARGYLLQIPGSHDVMKTPLMIPDHIWEAIKDAAKHEDLSNLIGVRPFGGW